ncbi:MAG: hypothetical protein JZD40_06890 [Sulfolobus sp.]|nr:hypothetical protein [Sulfolobus sp.]
MIRLEVEAKNLSSLTIGGTSYNITVDTPFNSLGIPPSTIKGVMRTAINFFLDMTLEKFTSCRQVEPGLIKESHKEPCDVCTLYGYPDSPEGKVTVEVKTKVEEKFVLQRVRINDKTNIAEEGALFSQEVIKPETALHFNVYYRGSKNDRLFKLLLYSLLALRLWRIGRNSMIDLKVKRAEEFINGGWKEFNIEEVDKEIGKALKRYLWGD